MVQATLAPGASVAGVAGAHGVNANQLFGWRRLYLNGRLGEQKPTMKLLPVRVSESLPPVTTHATGRQSTPQGSRGFPTVDHNYVASWLKGSLVDRSYPACVPKLTSSGHLSRTRGSASRLSAGRRRAGEHPAIRTRREHLPGSHGPASSPW
jgi:hypothetical protein